MEDLFDILTKFVAVAGAIDYGWRAIKLPVKLYDKFKNPYRRRK